MCILHVYYTYNSAIYKKCVLTPLQISSQYNWFYFLFRGKDSVEYKVGSDMSFLLKSSWVSHYYHVTDHMIMIYSNIMIITWYVTTDWKILIQNNLSKPNPFETEEFVQFKQVFGWHRFKWHRLWVYQTVKSVWFMQVFGLLRVRFRQVIVIEFL